MKKTIRIAATTALSLAFAGAVSAPPAPTELPTGGQIVSGAGVITQSATSMTVQQGTAKIITNWQTFNIGSQASVNFVQPSASSVALNRVLGADPSQIYGNLTANGQVFLLSPGGVIFGEGARVDVGGLMASTMNLSNADFLASNYRLSGGSEAVVNLGQLAAREGGFVALVGSTVENSGTITAPVGQVALAAGSAARLELGSSGLISVAVDSATAAKVENKGLITADGGRVFLTANRAAEALGAAVNQAGVVRANTLSNKNGEIWLDGGAGKTQISGQILASGTQTGQRGGKIVATGAEVVLGSGSEVNASGAAGGGEVFVGGGWQGKDPGIREARVVTQENGSAIRASATEDGDGGTIAIWSSDRTRISGELSARGAGAGKGGAIETSSRKDLGVASAAKIDAGADSGNGGLWLLDPTDITVVAGSGAATSTTVYADTLSSALATTSTSIFTADGSITVNAPISKISGSDATTLTFDALNDIVINQDISASSGQLNIVFGVTARDAGNTTINAALSTNGGFVDFFKATTLAHATPVSTKPSGGVSTSAGAITFYKDVTLASPTYSVTLNAQGAQVGSVYTSAGGTIDFKGSILSGKPASLGWSPQALVIDTTSSSNFGSGAVILGSSSSDVIGKTSLDFLEVTPETTDDFDPSLSTNIDGPLRSLTLAGPQVVDLKAGAINLANTSGNVLVASSIETASPKLRLNAANTQINLRGGAVAGLSTGYTDFVQDTFDFVAVNNSSSRAITVNSDRSIKVIGRSIAGVLGGTGGGGSLSVSLNSARAAGADGGAVILNNANLTTYGSSVTIGGSDNRATGYAFDSSGVTDGVNIQNTVINTAGGNLSVFGRSSADTGASSAGVRIIDISGPSTNLSSGAGNIVIDGLVQGQTSGSKEGVVIGEGGAALTTLQSTTGSITIVGSAGAITTPTAGSSYTGVIIGASTLLQTGSGAISVTGTGGGGDQLFISENHGVRLGGANTRIVSTSGDIRLTGTSGGKTSVTGGETSFGLFSSAANIYIGSDPIAGAPVVSTSDIWFSADSMNFALTPANRLRVASSGELLIAPLTTVTNIEFGAAGALPSGTLRLGSAWFDGASTAVFQPGFSGITVGRSDSTGRMTVAQATALRDNTYLMMGSGSPSAIAINAPLTVKRAGSNDRTLTLEANVGSITGTAAIDTDSLLIIGTGDVALTGSSLVNKLAANLDGQLDFVNAQNLQVSSVSGTKFQQSPVTNSGVATTNDNVNIRLTSGDLSLAQNINVGSATLGLTASAGRVTQSGASDSVAPIITAANLYVSSANTSRLNNQNLVTNLAANISAGGLEFRDENTLNIGLIPVTSRTANADGTVTASTTNRDGIVAQSTSTSVVGDTAGRVLLTVNTGNLTQETVGSIAGGAIKATELGVDMLTGTATLGNTANDIGTFAAIARGSTQRITLNESNGFTVGSVGILHGISTATDGNIALATNSGDITVTRSVSAGGAGTIDVRAGGAIAVNPASGQVARFESATGGTIQLIAGGAITTSTANSSGSDIPEISTSGSVVLRAGTSIGSDANRIEMFGNSVIAATAGGDIWLRRLGSGGFTVGSVGALAFNGVTTFTSTPNTLNGLTTAANDGNIALTRNAGSITVSQNIAAHGSGNVDIRAEGTDSDIVIGSTIQSGSGTIQLIANRDISASSATGNTAELLTTSNGRALLRAGNSIGAHGNAIDSSGDTSVAALLGTGTGHIVLNHIAGDLTVAEVSAVNVNSTLDGTAQNVGGLISANRNITVTTQGTSNLNLAAALNAGTGVIVLDSADGISQTAGGLTASAARIDATGDAVITQAGNRVNVLSSRARNLEYLDSGVLQIGSTGIADTVGLQSNVSATNSVWIRAQGQQNPADPGATALTIPAGFQVIGNGSVPNAVVLVADGAFVNQAGADAISTPNSRWLVYDINPDLVYRLDNLPFVWRRVDTTYERFLPSAITRIGNVYITSASPVRPNEYLPQKLSELKPLPTDPGFAQALAYAPKPYGAQPQFLVTAFGKPPVSLSGSLIFPVEGALSLVVRPGSYFESALAGQIAGERIKAASMADGSALPGWLKIDPVSQRISGVMPKEGGDFPITLQLEGANGAAGRVIELVLGAGT